MVIVDKRKGGLSPPFLFGSSPISNRARTPLLSSYELRLGRDVEVPVLSAELSLELGLDVAL